MSQPRSNGSSANKSGRGRNRGGKGQRTQRNQRRQQPGPAGLWTEASELPPVEPIVIPSGVGALIRSLGDGPAIGGSTVLDDYVVAVVERTAAVAAALAYSADLLVNPDE